MLSMKATVGRTRPVRRPARFAVPLIGALAITGLALNTTPASAAPPPAAGFNPNLQLKNSDGAGEPSIRTDHSGNSYVIGPTGFPTGGCHAFKVKPDGSASTDLGFPDHNVGGGDCDWALGPPETGSTNDVLGYSSLLLSSIVTGKSTDGGATFSPPNLYGQTVPADDRMWNAADPQLNGAGLDDMFMTYHDLHTDQIWQETSVNGGASYTGVPNGVINPAEVPPQQWTSSCPGAGCVVGGPAVFAGNELGNIVARRTATGLTLYSIFTTPDSGTDNTNSVNEENRVYAAVAHVTDVPGTLIPQQPITWDDYEIWHGPLNTIYSQIFPVISVDNSGRVYAAFSDASHMYVKSTADPTNWGCPAASTVPGGSDPCTVAPTQIDTLSNGYPAGENTSIMPWMAAPVTGSGSALDVVWYGAHGGVAGKNLDANAVWDVYMAQTIDGGASWKVSTVSDHHIHTGPICTQGDACTAGSRTLLDFFQVAIDPTNGAATVTWADDHLNPGIASLYFTRQCSGDSVTTYANPPIASSSCLSPPAPPPPPPFGSICPGPQILDLTGDAPNNYPGGDGANMPMFDILNAFFGTTESAGHAAQIIVTLTLNNLSAPPPPPNIPSGQWSVLFTIGSTHYFVEADSNGSGSNATVQFSDGTISNGTATFTNTAVPGQFNTGPNGTIVWVVPVADLGNPANNTVITNTFANDRGTIAVQGNGLQYTAAADTAPPGDNPANAGFGADYVINQSCPAATTPEAPLTALLLGGGFIGGSAGWIRRQRRRRRVLLAV
jgi:hypothetical protein